MSTATISLKGMTCSGCVNSVMKALKAVDGVDSAEVSLEKHQATVTFDESKASVASLKLAIEDAGFDAV